MPRTDGRKIVAIAFGATTLAIGIGQIYLPYIADRDKLRGLFEEEDMPMQAKKEMEMMMRKDRLEKENQSDKANNNGSSFDGGERNGTSAGSMWKNLRRN